MIELKAGVIKTPHDEGMSFIRDSDHVAVTEGETEFYLKSEVDGEIARLNKKLDIYKRGFREDDRINVFLCKSVRHQKYKRCLAMVEMCGVACDKWTMKKNRSLILGEDGAEYYSEASKKVRHYMRWQRRWLKIAKQFKENK